MKLVLCLLVLSSTAQAIPDKEGDLQLPVTEIQQRQEERIPTLDEVKMYEDRPVKSATTQTRAPAKKRTHPRDEGKPDGF